MVYRHMVTEIASKVIVINRIVNHHRFGRIHRSSGTYRSRLRITSIGYHTFCAEVHRQMFIKEGRIQIQAQRVTLVIGSLQDTLLVGITKAKTIRKILVGTGNCHIMVGTDGRTINLVLPIRISKQMFCAGSRSDSGNLSAVIRNILVGTVIAHACIIIACQPFFISHTGLALDIIHKLRGIQHIHLIDHFTERHVSIVGNSRLHAFAAFLGRDNDDTIGSTATINSCGRSVFQYRKAFNIGRVYQVQRVGHTLHTIIIHR